MAKIKHCKFCGKEMQKKLFGSEVRTLDIEGNYYIDCCEECYQRENSYLESYPQGERLRDKISNLGFGSATEEEVAKSILKYREDYEMYKETRGHIVLDENIKLDGLGGFSCNKDGYFWVQEGRKKLKKEKKNAVPDLDKFEKDLAKQNGATKKDLMPFAFDKNDITKLQYTIESPETSNGWFYVLIRFNDENVLTCKPCISRQMVYVKGLFKKKKIKEMVTAFLTEFKEKMGVDLPIEYVKDYLF